VADRLLTGVLLLGGASSRFGSDKALALFEGETLAARAWRTLGEACDERLAFGKAGGADLPFAVTADASDVQHPAAGIVAALRAAAHDVCVVLPVDCPLVPAEALRALGEACADAAWPAGGGPLPGAYARSALPILERCLAEQGSLRRAFGDARVITVPIALGLLADVDTPEALAAIERDRRG
jgi:molybdopterin-guanine dinucleotide biosynthesis protein A